MSKGKAGRNKGTRVDPAISAGAGGKRTSRAPPAGAGSKRTYVPPTLTSTERVCWHFGAMDFEGPYGWNSATRDDLLKVVSVVRAMEKQTATEIFDQAKYRQSVGATKAIPVENICPDAQRRLRQLELDEHELLYEVRITRPARVWCLRFETVACLLWWDPFHRVCPRSR